MEGQKFFWMLGGCASGVISMALGGSRDQLTRSVTSKAEELARVQSIVCECSPLFS